MAATYTKPTKVPRWADSGLNTLEPIEAKKDEGWTFQEVPPSNWENWKANLAGSWFKWLNERFFDGASKDELLIKSPGGAISALLITDAGVAIGKGLYVGATGTAPTDDAIVADGSGTFGLGLRVGFAGVPTADRIEIGDAAFYFDLGTANPKCLCDTKDYSTFIRASDYWQWFINDIEKVRLGAGLSVVDGLQVGFIGAPSPCRLEVGDTAFFLGYSGNDPQIVFATDDLIRFTRASNYWSWLVGGNEYLRLTAVGELCWITPRSGTTTTKAAVEMDSYTGKLVGGDGTNVIRYEGQALAAYEVARSSDGNFATLTIPASTLRQNSIIHVELMVIADAGASGAVNVQLNANQIGFVDVGNAAPLKSLLNVMGIVTADPGASVDVRASYFSILNADLAYTDYALVNIATNASVTLAVALFGYDGAGSVTLKTLRVSLT